LTKKSSGHILLTGSIRRDLKKLGDPKLSLVPLNLFLEEKLINNC